MRFRLVPRSTTFDDHMFYGL